MIISTFHMEDRTDVKVSLYHAASTEPVIVHLCNGNSIHLSVKDAERLQLQLTAALHEYDTAYKYKETT